MKLKNIFAMAATASTLILAQRANAQFNNVPLDSTAYNPRAFETQGSFVFTNNWADKDQNQIGFQYGSNLLNKSFGIGYEGKAGNDLTTFTARMEQQLIKHGAFTAYGDVGYGRVFGGPLRKQPLRAEFRGAIGAGYQKGMNNIEGLQDITPWYITANFSARGSATIAKTVTLSLGYDFRVIQGFTPSGSGNGSGSLKRTGAASNFSVGLAVPIAALSKR